jgi:PhnB protein
MAIILNPYLNFRDNARQAMEFYHGALGGELNVSSFKDFGASQSPDEDDLVMHSMLKTPNGLVLMGADTPMRMEYQPGTNFGVSLSGDQEDEETLRGYFERLSAGGQVTMPLDKAPWGDTFGMLKDKFGVTWLVNIAGEQSQKQ